MPIVLIKLAWWENVTYWQSGNLLHVIRGWNRARRFLAGHDRLKNRLMIARKNARAPIKIFVKCHCWFYYCLVLLKITVAIMCFRPKNVACLAAAPWNFVFYCSLLETVLYTKSKLFWQKCVTINITVQGIIDGLGFSQTHFGKWIFYQVKLQVPDQICPL